jgi:hypothetical protein
MYVQDLVLFTGLKEADLPKRPHNCLGADASFERLLNVLGQISGPRRNDRNATITFGSDEVFDAILEPTFPLFEKLEPTPLDRRRMDRIAKSGLPEGWLDDLGQRQVLLRGRGGVGKTVILLQMAYRAFDQHQQRSLILTFNKVLVADLRRTMALLGVPRSVERGGIAIETVHAFIGRLMLRLGVITSYGGFLETYEEKKEMLLSYLRDGAITDEDVKIVEQSDDFAWDLVFVDERQDWPCNEIEILRTTYGAQHLAMSGMWKRSHGRTSEAPPDERGGYRYVRPTATASHLDSTHLPPWGPSRRRSLHPTDSGHSGLAAGAGLHAHSKPRSNSIRGGGPCLSLAESSDVRHLQPMVDAAQSARVYWWRSV